MSKEYLKALSRARELLALLDKALALTGDPDTFSVVKEKEVEALQVPLLNSRRATANILSSLGDDRGYRNPPPEQILRSPIHVNEPQISIEPLPLTTVDQDIGESGR
jgi:hypothetical protein